MGNRTTIPIAAVILLAATGCGHPDNDPAAMAPSLNAAASSAPEQPTPPPVAPSTPPFRAASAEVTTLATWFLRTVVEYDTTREGRLAFLRRVQGLVTAAELDRLAHSPRARLPWRILRVRSERTNLVVNGVTAPPGTRAAVRVIVAATVTVHTTFASVTGFRRYTLTLLPVGDVWVVDRADGIDR